MSGQPITDEGSQTHHAASAAAAPPAPAAKEKPKEPEGAGVEPAIPGHISSKQTEDVPEIQPEQVGSSGTPQQQQQQQQQAGAEEEEPGQGGQEVLLGNQELVREAEKELWATVEETAVEGSKELSEEEQEEQQKQEEQHKQEEQEEGGGVTGG